MQPVDLHNLLLRALPERQRPISLDELVCLAPAGPGQAGDVARWLGWARAEGLLVDAGVYDGRRCLLLRELDGEEARPAPLHPSPRRVRGRRRRAAARLLGVSPTR